MKDIYGIQNKTHAKVCHLNNLHNNNIQTFEKKKKKNQTNNQIYKIKSYKWTC